jgi:nonribosomal peptide synthetase DhbF
VIPLSFAQRRLWFLNQIEEATSSYNIPLAFRLRGPVNVEALHDALLDVVARHEPLRTQFPQSDGVIRQQILAPEQSGFRLSVVSSMESAVADELVRAARRPFDIEREIPFTAQLFAVGENESVLLLVIHHIAADGWSLGPLLRDLQAAYAARVRGKQPEWASLPVQYADYAAWQQDLLGHEDDGESVAAKQLAFWKEALADLPVELSLPFDRSRPAAGSMKGGHVRIAVSASTQRKLMRLVVERNASLFMALHAAVAALLSRLGAGDDVPLGTAIAGRTDSALDDLVGCFVNTLVLRARVGGNPTFLQLLEQSRETAFEAYAHQDLPFERLVEVLSPERSAARHPLFQVMLTLQNTGEAAFDLDGVSVEAHPVALDVAKFDLMFTFRELAGGIELELAYAADLFDRETALSIAARLERLLDAVAENAQVRIGEIDLLSESERRQVLSEWNATDREQPQGTLAALFEEQDPDAVALVGEMTYGQLNARANQLAHQLIAQSVGPEQMVGVSMPRSLEMIVALVGILKAGAAYLPLDPEYPQARIELMVKDARPVCILTAEDIKKLDGELPTTNPAPRGTIDNACYAMYTSGSTGTPKGIVVSQRAVIRLVRNGGFARLDGDTTIAQFAPLSFDASTFEIWGALLNGGRLAVLAPGLPALEELGAELRDKQVDTLWLTAGLFHQMVEQRLEDLRGIRQLLAGGDVLDPVAVRRVLQNVPGCTVINGYGPTEATTFTCCHAMGKEEQVGERVAIGAPIGNTRGYVLDEQLQPVPVGVWGELYIAGPGLARGYLGQSGMTAERFVANPWTRGERMYRSGDVVRWRGEGTLEFRGRADQQIKLRGFRVEPGEIEAALRRQSGVSQAVVMVREDQPGDKRLVAYVSGEGLNGEKLRGALRAELPEYMTPSAMVVLGALPLNANGKIDRKALPAPQYAQKQFRAPRTPQEEILCALFAETLGVERVGLDDNFFELGGDSLKSIRLVSRCRATGIDLTARDVFLYQTVEQLAAAPSASVRPRVDLPSQVILAEDIRPAARRKRSAAPPKDVLLTGATGFLGAHLLAELLDATEATVRCLVRAQSEADGERRLRQTFDRYGIAPLRDRVRIIPGDLAQPRLGLSDVALADLARGVEAIYHAGAAVNSLYSYDILKGVNVDGTSAIVRLACTGRPKPLHFVSTVSVFPVNRRGWPEPLDDEALPAAWPRLQTGYAQSKWVAEGIVSIAEERGLPVTIYRPSLISGSSVTGIVNPADFLSLLLRACVAIEQIPDLDLELNLIPVDFVSKALVAISRSRKPKRSYNLVNGRTVWLRQIAEWIVELCPATRIVPYAEWRAAVAARPELAALLAFFPDASSLPRQHGTRRPEKPSRPDRVAPYRNFSLTCPPITPDLLKLYLDAFSQGAA